ncbi:MAG TPA: hypothetical protein VLS90_04715 [Thermodesulfobacteriota bacterium]|nr:hypothetical protein [Thermodesulfobacteriota bacterium]
MKVFGGVSGLASQILGQGVLDRFVLQDLGEYALEELKTVCIEHEPAAQSEITHIDDSGELLNFMSRL